jgi:molybdenum cofactor cytidylyltransferase
LIQSASNGMRESLYEKSIDVAGRHLATIDATLTKSCRCAHSIEGIAECMTELKGTVDLILVLGASSPVDRRDVMPVALGEAGGEIVHLGMPVDPGNLTLVGRLGEAWVFGLPGSARSPRAHGFDLLLRRVAAGLDITGDDIRRMAMGGVLKEPLVRPARAVDLDQPLRIGAVVLAAGKSSRMGDRNKLLEVIDGTPIVVRTLEMLQGSRVDEIVLVTGHDANKIKEITGSLNVTTAANPDYAEGLSTSLRAGLAALGPDLDGILVCLSDMPDLTADIVNRLIDRFNPAERAGIVIPVVQGQRGNPVLFDAIYREEIGGVTGDMGAREVIRLHPDDVAEVELEDAAVLTDLDTPEAWAEWRKARDAQ